MSELNSKCLTEPEQGCDGHCCSVEGCCNERLPKEEYCQEHLNNEQQNDETAERQDRWRTPNRHP